MISKYHKYLISIIFLALFLFSIYYTYYLRVLVDDELYNYGFAKNIIDGLVPYVDFNMIVPPLFHYVLSLFLLFFGKKLLVYHIVIALLVVGITYIAYRKVGFRAIGIYFLLLVYPYIGYNIFSLFLFMLLLMIGDRNDYISALLISGLFFSKQTLGILIIPSLIYAKRKGKVFLIYCALILSFLVYLLLHNSFIGFIDYCFLGMFHFASDNSQLTVFLFIEIVVIGILLMLLIKTKKREYFYILCFQVITLPIVDYVHFWVAFIPVVYLLMNYFKKSFVSNIFLIGFSVAYFVIFTCSILFSKSVYHYVGRYPDYTFMKGRVSYIATSYYIHDMKEQMNKYSDYEPYVLGSFSYLVKLNLNMKINHYDIINNGNMGYEGEKRYVREIDNNCQKHKCVFFISDEEAEGKVYNQVNLKILEYVITHYEKKYSSNTFSVYVN